MGQTTMSLFIRFFPAWAIAISLIAYHNPSYFKGSAVFITPLLMFIMLCMGLSLQIKDFARVLTVKRFIAVGVLLQFTVMPIAAWLLATAFMLSDDYKIGMLLVGCVAGGTVSNVMCFIAKGDVALSISMTAISTLLSIVLTPIIISGLAGRTVDIPIDSITFSLIQIVAAPVLIGILVRSCVPKLTDALNDYLPLLSIIAILAVIAIVVGLNAERGAAINLLVLPVVILHNLIGLTAGYGASAILGFDEKVRRTIAFEVGLQNSGLATALAVKYFSAGAAVPSVVFSIWHNISGSFLASWWSRK
ncbi:bile acid:sodium symporter family protein [Hirschia maritima]|uniref:bile acid:sodium symporter family protein n=1 Tax=Hirschia maritima TaxID=1121961 RepID=UPI0003664E88|nr:bile acid:sodium symporter family protein [Hirschia maritima]